MAEFKDRVPHTGGVLTIRIASGRYQLRYEHHNAHFVRLAELLAMSGKPVAVVPILGVGLREEVPDPQLRVMLPSDSEGMYGRRCPACKGYFRASNPFVEMCAYCPKEGSCLQFFTDDQNAFVAHQYGAIREALAGPDGDTTVSFDAQASEPSSPHTWVYSEEAQQRHFECPQCRTAFDVLGDYVKCPTCARFTAIDIVPEKISRLRSLFEGDAASMPNTTPAERQAREQRWRQHTSAAVAEFEAFGRHIAEFLVTLPATASRKKAISGLSFQNIVGTAESLSHWFGFDILRGVAPDERPLLHRMFHRRHLFIHTGGRVDEEYLARSGDDTVRLHEVVRVNSRQVRRLIEHVETVSTNLLLDVQSIETE